jgi:hypothetical protein
LEADAENMSDGWLRSGLPVGESGKVRVGQTNVLVRCVAIATNSVRVEISGSGETQELWLAPRR